MPISDLKSDFSMSKIIQIYLKYFFVEEYQFREKRAKSFLFQSMSMNLQRGNALCVMGTVAHHRKLEEIYNLGTIQTQEQEG